MNTIYDTKRAMTQSIEIGEWLKERREAQGLSIRKFAENVDIPHSTIADIEKGVKPSVNTLKKLAAYFKVEESYLFVMARIMDGTTKVKGNLIEAIIFETNELPPADQEEVLDYVRLRKKRFEERKKPAK